MKKIILVPALLGVMGIGAIFAVTNGDLTGSANKVLTVDEIQKKALAEVNGAILDVQLDKSSLQSYYQVNVAKADETYDLIFDAKTGELLNKDNNYANVDDNSHKNVVTVAKQMTSAVTQQQAIQIALNKVNGTVTKAGMDDYSEYDIEVVSADYEYDFVIDATTGTINKMEQDFVD